MDSPSRIERSNQADANEVEAVLIKASVAAEQALRFALLKHHPTHSTRERQTGAAATITYCNIVRYWVMSEISTRQGLAPLLWMLDTACALVEAKKWYFEKGNPSLIEIARERGYDLAVLKQELKTLKQQHPLHEIGKYKPYRNKTGYHYDHDMLLHLDAFGQKDDYNRFLDIIRRYKTYSDGWAKLFKKIVGVQAS